MDLRFLSSEPVFEPERVTIGKSTYKLALWTRQLFVLFKSSVPLIQAMEVLAEQPEDRVFRRILEDIAQRVRNGVPFSKALSTYPRVFSKVYVGLVRAGESSGQLGDCLERLATMLERESSSRQRLGSALAYPAFVLVTTIVLTLCVFYTILPNFINIFRDQHLELPFITKVLIFVTDTVRNPGFWALLLSTGLCLYVALPRIAASKQGGLFLFKLLLGIPILGICFRLACLARFCWVLESVLGSGMPLLSCVKLASAACGNPFIRRDITRVAQHISDGEPLSEYFRNNADTYHRLMSHMVSVGEESSSLQQTFGHLASWFNQEMEDRLDLLSATLEPVLMTGLALMVGTIVIGIFVPLYGLIGNLGN